MAHYLMRLCILLFLSAGQSANAQVLFETVLGFQRDDNGSAGFEDASGNFVVVGSSQDVSTTVKDIYVVKLDSAGVIIWEKKFGGTAAEEGFGAAIDDDRYLAFGHTASFGAGGSDFYLVKTREDGSTVWERTYGGTGSDIGRDVIVTSDGAYAMTGYSNSTGTHGSFDGYLVKTNDTSGAVAWEKWYGGSQFEFPIRVVETYDGGFVVPCQSTSFGSGYQWYTVRTDNLGDTVWTRLFGTPGADFVHEAAEAADSGIVLVGTTVTPLDSAQLTLLKYDKNGNQLWVKYPRLTRGDRPFGIKATPDGGFVITGHTSTFDRNFQTLLLKVDANGDSLWVCHFGGLGNEHAQHVALTSDGGFLLTGMTDGFNTPNMDLYVVKTGALCEWPCPDTILMTADTNEVCIGQAVSFTNSTITSSSPEWLVNGVLQATSWNYVHQFNTTGDHTVELVICDDTASILLTVHALPDAGFSFTQVDGTFSFTLDAPGQAASVMWYFGDGDTSSGLNPVHTYQADGQFNVTLVLTDTNGCAANTSQVVAWVGIEETVLNFHVGPNPFDREVIITLAGDVSGDISMYNALGEVVLTGHVDATLSMAVGDLPSGLYVLRLISDGKSGTVSLVKAR